jgi:hypothetical protein
VQGDDLRRIETVVAPSSKVRRGGLTDDCQPRVVLRAPIPFIGVKVCELARVGTRTYEQARVCESGHASV